MKKKLKPLKNEKIFLKYAQTEDAHLQCVNNHIQSLNIKEWKLFELQITQTKHPQNVAEGQTDGERDVLMEGQSGPITRPAFLQGDTGKNHSFSVVYLFWAVELSCSAELSVK